MKQFKTINQNKADMEIGYKQEIKLEEAAGKYAKQYALSTRHISHIGFEDGAKWQQEQLLKFIWNEDNHTEGELGNSCIDVQTLVNFIEQFKKK
jgi:hypothetical protein